MRIVIAGGNEHAMLAGEYQGALRDWSLIRTLYSSDSLEVAQAARRLETLEAGLRLHRGTYVVKHRLFNVRA